MRAMLFTLLLTPLAHAADLRPTVAILYFDYSGKDPDMGVLKKGLAQMLISDLSNMASLDSVRFVERDRLEEVLSELKLAQSGKIDPQTAAKVGKLLGARYMVLGGYFDLMQTLRADARVVEVESGRVLQSTGATGKPEEFLAVEQKLSEGIAKILAEKATPMKADQKHAVEGAKPGEQGSKPGEQGVKHGAAEGPVRATTVGATPLRGKEGSRAERPKPPSQLKTSTALKYSRALHKLDSGDKEGAKKELQAVVKEQPDFRLATLDMDRLIQ